jgi:hypothetical protein
MDIFELTFPKNCEPMFDLKCEQLPKMYRFTLKKASLKRVGQSRMQVKKYNVK